MGAENVFQVIVDYEFVPSLIKYKEESKKRHGSIKKAFQELIKETLKRWGTKNG